MNILPVKSQGVNLDCLYSDLVTMFSRVEDVVRYIRNSITNFYSVVPIIVVTANLLSSTILFGCSA